MRGVADAFDRRVAEEDEAEFSGCGSAAVALALDQEAVFGNLFPGRRETGRSEGDIDGLCGKNEACGTNGTGHYMHGVVEGASSSPTAMVAGEHTSTGPGGGAGGLRFYFIFYLVGTVLDTTSTSVGNISGFELLRFEIRFRNFEISSVVLIRV